MEVDAAPARDADAAGGALTSGAAPTGAGGRRRSRLLVAAVVVLVVLLVASVALIVVRGRQVHAHNQLEANRSAALQAAEQFTLRMDAFDGADLDAYTKSVSPLLTDKEKTVFSQQLQQFQKLYQQVQKASQKAGKGKGKSSKTPQPGTGSIVMAGVSQVDADSATVLVAHDSTIPGASQKLHSRWTISMRKIDGDWLVDSFTPVA